MAEEKNSPPVKKFSIGTLHLAVFEHEKKESDGTFLSADLTKSYKVGDEWKDGRSLNPDDWANAMELYRRALEWEAQR